MHFGAKSVPGSMLPVKEVVKLPPGNADSLLFSVTSLTGNQTHVQQPSGWAEGPGTLVRHCG